MQKSKSQIWTLQDCKSQKVMYTTSAECSSSQFSTRLSKTYGASCMSWEYSPSIHMRAALALGSWTLLLLIFPTTAIQSWLHWGYFLRRSFTSTCIKWTSELVTLFYHYQVKTICHDFNTRSYINMKRYNITLRQKCQGI